MIPPVRTARRAGAFHLGFVVSDPLTLLLYFVLFCCATSRWLDRLIPAVDGLTAVLQVLAAVWLRRLFHRADRVAAAGIVVFGVATALVMLAITTRTWSLFDVTGYRIYQPTPVDAVLRTAGGILSGLWVAAIGRCVWRSGWLPAVLGFVLLAGGVAILVNTATSYRDAETSVFGDVATGLTFVGNIWLIGCLLVRGRRGRAEVHRRTMGANSPFSSP